MARCAWPTSGLTLADPTPKCQTDFPRDRLRPLSSPGTEAEASFVSDVAAAPLFVHRNAQSVDRGVAAETASSPGLPRFCRAACGTRRRRFGRQLVAARRSFWTNPEWRASLILWSTSLHGRSERVDFLRHPPVNRSVMDGEPSPAVAGDGHLAGRGFFRLLQVARRRMNRATVCLRCRIHPAA